MAKYFFKNGRNGSFKNQNGSQCNAIFLWIGCICKEP